MKKKCGKNVNDEAKAKVELAKSKYKKNLEDKLCNSSTNNNMFWSVVNRIAGKKKETNIPPLLEDGVFITSFPDKANIFNEFLLVNVIPWNMIVLYHNFSSYLPINSRPL